MGIALVIGPDVVSAVSDGSAEYPSLLEGITVWIEPLSTAFATEICGSKGLGVNTTRIW